MQCILALQIVMASSLWIAGADRTGLIVAAADARGPQQATPVVADTGELEQLDLEEGRTGGAAQAGGESAESQNVIKHLQKMSGPFNDAEHTAWRTSGLSGAPSFASSRGSSSASSGGTAAGYAAFTMGGDEKTQRQALQAGHFTGLALGGLGAYKAYTEYSPNRNELLMRRLLDEAEAKSRAEEGDGALGELDKRELISSNEKVDEDAMKALETRIFAIEQEAALLGDGPNMQGIDGKNDRPTTLTQED